jgi:hypothetical protein
MDWALLFEDILLMHVCSELHLPSGFGINDMFQYQPQELWTQNKFQFADGLPPSTGHGRYRTFDL